ncbi:Hint domain-containing protein [Fangia hongkongensis]|uniref:Hint domain-containing protein n=2 Tax=Fangia hongkongensis TaxID=270495 RepID=UPI00035E3F4A|nr:Hint domain-containing protein [Fangia hongkongensis]
MKLTIQYRRVALLSALITLFNPSFAQSINFNVKTQHPPQTWYTLNLQYNDAIEKHLYPAEIKLLRPLSWLKVHHIEKVGDKLTLSISEFGINQVNATVTQLTPSTLNITASNHSKETTRPVIGIFKRYAKTVNTYTFQDRNGKVEQIHATPTHPFYVINKKRFIAIDELSSQDQLLSAYGREVQLVCPKGKFSHCGQRYNKDDKPILVYNIEVYQAHNYYVGRFTSLVHNSCDFENTPFSDMDIDALTNSEHTFNSSLPEYQYISPVKKYEDIITFEEIYAKDAYRLVKQDGTLDGNDENIYSIHSIKSWFKDNPWKSPMTREPIIAVENLLSKERTPLNEIIEAGFLKRILIGGAALGSLFGLYYLMQELGSKSS